MGMRHSERSCSGCRVSKKSSQSFGDQGLELADGRDLVLREAARGRAKCAHLARVRGSEEKNPSPSFLGRRGKNVGLEFFSSDWIFSHTPEGFGGVVLATPHFFSSCGGRMAGKSIVFVVYGMRAAFGLVFLFGMSSFDLVLSLLAGGQSTRQDRWKPHRGMCFCSTEGDGCDSSPDGLSTFPDSFPIPLLVSWAGGCGHTVPGWRVRRP